MLSKGYNARPAILGMEPHGVYLKLLSPDVILDHVIFSLK